MTTTTRPAAVPASSSATPTESLAPLAGLVLPAALLQHASRFCAADPLKPQLGGVRLQWQQLSEGQSVLSITFSKRGKTPTWFIHRRIDRGPWLPAEDLFARGPLEHVKAKVRSAIRSAQPATG